jgi:hypothetical protein
VSHAAKIRNAVLLRWTEWLRRLGAGISSRVACFASHRAGLHNKWLQVYWPDDRKWWPGRVADINVRERRVVLLYETSARQVVVPRCSHSCC